MTRLNQGLFKGCITNKNLNRAKIIGLDLLSKAFTKQLNFASSVCCCLEHAKCLSRYGSVETMPTISPTSFDTLKSGKIFPFEAN